MRIRILDADIDPDADTDTATNADILRMRLLAEYGPLRTIRKYMYIRNFSATEMSGQA
jgi:hypothetical protein